jgi:transaldolase
MPVDGYFHRLSREYPTELFINNPTLAEAEMALQAGAIGATTNPTYPSRLLKEEPEYVGRLIEQAVRETDDDNQAADLVYQRAVGRLQKLFHPLYIETQGHYGYVAMQGDPRLNTDPVAILDGAVRYRQLGENMIIKVPSWPAGAVALEQMIAMGIPTIGTLGFSLDQAIFMAEAYRRALQHSASRPPCHVVFIAGVLDTHLADAARQAGNPGLGDLIQYAGSAVNRKVYYVFKSRGYEARVQGGGARGPHHFLDLVGGDLSITIGWNLAQQLIEADEPVVSRIDVETPEQTISALEAGLPDFRKSYEEGSLRPEEFQEFGPVVGFQKTFLAGVEVVVASVAATRGAARLEEGVR